MMSKNFNLFITILAIVLLNSCMKSDKATIYGKIENLINYNKIYLSEYNLTYEKLIDSAVISKSGEFKLSVKLKQPQLFKLFLPNNQYIWLLLSPHEKVSINILGNNLNLAYELKGSLYSKQVKELTDTLDVNRKKLDSLYKAAILAQLKKNDKELLKIDNQYQQVIKQQRNYSLKFIFNNLKSPATIFTLYQQFNDSLYVFYKPSDLQYIKIVADTLSKYYPESHLVKSLCVERNRLLTEYEAIRKQNKILSAQSLEQRNFPEIKLSSITVDTIQLSKSINKLTLLVFWTPLDRDCQIALNSFASLYNKYHEKGFDLFTVALFDDKGYWSNYIKKLNLPGNHVIDEWGLQSVFAKTYNVRFLPSTFLITKSGIVTRDLFGDKLEKQIILTLGK